MQMSKSPQDGPTMPIPRWCCWAEAATGVGICPFAPKWLFLQGQVGAESPSPVGCQLLTKAFLPLRTPRAAVPRSCAKPEACPSMGREDKPFPQSPSTCPNPPSSSLPEC